MKLWHDDVRPPPDKTWTWARTNDTAKSILERPPFPITEVSLDHDLGYAGPPPGPCEGCDGRGTVYSELPDSGDTAGTYVRCRACDGDGFIGGDVLYVAGTSEDDGRKLVKWMVENDRVPPKVTIHSWNPSGAKAMADLLRLHGHDPIVRPCDLRSLRRH